MALPPTTANNPLLNPNQGLSGQALLQAAQALTNAQTTGPLQELMKQIALNNRQGAATEKVTHNYFNQLGQYAQAGTGQERQIANDLNQQLAGISNQTQGQLSQYGQQAMQSPGLQGLSRSGLDGGATAQLAAELARQKGVEAQNAGTFRSGGAVQGANYRGLAASNLGSYALGGQQRLGQIAQATRLANEPVNAKIANLRATQGSLLAANEGKLRQQEIANRFTAKGLSLKGQAIGVTRQNNLANQALRAAGLNADISYHNAQIKIAGINAQLRSQGLSETKRHDLQNEKLALQRIQKPSGAKGPVVTPTGQRALPTSEQNRIFGYIDNARSLIPQMQQPLSSSAASSLQKHGFNVKQGQRLSESQIRQLLTSGIHPGGNTRFNAAEVDAAYALAGYGFLTNRQIAELNKLGVIVGSHYKRGTPGGNSVGAGIQATGNSLGF